MEAAKHVLKAIIKGKETLAQGVNPRAKRGNEVFKTFKVAIPNNEFTLPAYRGLLIEMKIHSDCHCVKISEFLRDVTEENLCIVLGTDRGHKLGLSGKPIENLQIYVKNKR